MNNYHEDEDDRTSQFIATLHECGELAVAVHELQEQINTITLLAERKIGLLNRFIDHVEETVTGTEYFDTSLQRLLADCKIYRIINNIDANIKTKDSEGSVNCGDANTPQQT